MDAARFQQLAREGYNRIPVWRSIAADLDTPLSVYLKLVDGPNAFLLESVEGGESWGRYSIIGLPCRRAWRASGRVFETLEYGRVTDRLDDVDPLACVENLLAQYKVPKLDDLPGFSGGLVGYFGYETIVHMQPGLRLADKPNGLGAPEMLLLEAEELAVFDNLAGRLYLIVNADPDQPHAREAANRRLDQLVHRLRCGSPGYLPPQGGPAIGRIRFGFEEPDFKRAVAQIRARIQSGEVMQVVISQRMSVELAARPLDVYRALRSLNPSPYMYFFDFGDFQVIGSSPEVLVRVTDGEAMVRPIAGTRRRGRNRAEDRRLEEALRADPKELAEHRMLIDLGRNDIARIARPGTVRLAERMVIERYSHVMHLVSEVRGQVAAGLNPIDVLRATFPAGTLSGAPKRRALEIIDRLEPVSRGVYAGAVGHLDWHGNTDLAIVIRTALVADGVLHLQAGAGIVADSDPQKEWQETLDKGQALIRAVSAAAGGQQ